MAQHDYIIANQSGAAFRSDLNNGLAAIVSQNSGAAQPSTTYAYQWWADTTTGLLKIRNAANNAWITIGTLADANLGLLSLAGGTLTGNLTLNAQSDLRLADADSSNWVALQAPATVATNLTLTAPAADGTADQALVTDGSGALSFASRSRLVRTTGFNSTSGTIVDFIDIPSWARRITVMLLAVSTNGTSGVQIQLGDSGGVETTGYSTSGTAITGTNTCGISTFTSGFVMLGSLLGASRSGAIIFTNISGNYWVGIGNMDEQGGAQAGYTQGYKELSATLDRIRVTTINGTDAFDAGFVNIIYEG
jgi:hypothetical protein